MEFFFWFQKVHYFVHEISPLVPVLSHLNPVYTPFICSLWLI
jgi:hypothetical protein